MSLPDRELLELNEQCQALIDGRLAQADRVRLEQKLADSAEARKFYVRTMALSASLCEYAGEMQTEVVPMSRVTGDTVFLPVPHTDFMWLASPVRYAVAFASLAAAALVVIGLWLGSHLGQRAGVETVAVAQESDEVVARVSGGKDGRWNGVALAAGEELHRGQQLQLFSGLAEIAFDSGAVVVLEGPASLELTSAWEAVLHRGTLKAQVPKEAIGFRVSNPDVEVVDLGTEFSMVADEQGATEVFVLKGSVETRTGEGAQPLVLREKEARRFAKTGGSEVRDREQKWRRLARLVALDRTPRPLKFAHWTFDELVDGVHAPATAVGYDASALPASLGSGGLTEGRFGRALRLDGDDWGAFSAIDLGQGGDHALIGLSAFSDPVRTVAFWVKVSADAPLSEAGPMLVWPMRDREAQVELSWNNQPALGPLGALQTKIARGFNIGTTSLRDGQWHHVTVELIANRKTNEKVQVRQYVDGRLDGISARRMGRRAARGEHVAERNENLLIGLSPHVETSLPKPAYHFFRGAIDELYIANRALSPAEIQELISENRFPVTATP